MRTKTLAVYLAFFVVSGLCSTASAVDFLNISPEKATKRLQVDSKKLDSIFNLLFLKKVVFHVSKSESFTVIADKSKSPTTGSMTRIFMELFNKKKLEPQNYEKNIIYKSFCEFDVIEVKYKTTKTLKNAVPIVDRLMGKNDKYSRVEIYLTDFSPVYVYPLLEFCSRL